MKVYLAARYGSQPAMREIAGQMKQCGITVTSRWIWGDYEYLPPFRCAQDDLEDVEEADVLLAFSPREGFNSGSGGRHVELGYALALHKRVLLVGERENVFHSMVPAVATAEEAIGWLTELMTSPGKPL